MRPNDEPFEAGLYQVQLLADQYAGDLGDAFPVGDDEDRELGDLPARSNLVRLEEVTQCGPIPSRGGRCQFTVGVANGQAAALQARGWIAVTGFSFDGISRYQLPQTTVDHCRRN